VSSDLVTWTHLPPAIAPTPGAFDSLACFSGCCFTTDDGGVTMLCALRAPYMTFSPYMP
jgi:beta-fructofuranosidase